MVVNITHQREMVVSKLRNRPLSMFTDYKFINEGFYRLG